MVKNKVDLLIPITGSDTQAAAEFSKLMQNKGYNCHIITTWNYSDDYLKKRNIPYTNLYKVLSDKAWNKKYSFKELKKYEDKYNYYSTEWLSYPEQVYYSRSSEWVKQRIIPTILSIEKILKSINPEFIFQLWVGGELFRRLFYYISKKQHIKHFFVTHSGFPNRCVFTEEDERAQWVTNHKVYNDSATLNLWKQIISEMLKKKKQTAQVMPIGLKWSSFLSPFIYPFKEKIKNPVYHWKHIYLKGTLDIFQRFIARQYYQNLPLSDFVLFPLHLHTDSKITSKNPQYSNQSSLVNYIARCLPAGVKLVIKEHPMAVGKTKLSLLREFNKNNNIILANPTVNSYDLIRRSKLVIVIGSNTGIEALLLKKNVIVIGNCYFRDIDSVYNIKDLYNLPAIIKKVINSSPPPWKNVINELYEFFKLTYNCPGGSMHNAFKLEKLDETTFSVIKYIEKWKKRII